MGDDDGARTGVHQVPDRRGGADDAGGIGDFAVLHRNVEIDANDDALVRRIKVVESLERCHGAILAHLLFGETIKRER